MDIGHLRSIRWVKDDNPQSAINAKPELTHNGKSAAQNRWIAYNKMRGQYNSAMEHAVPEQFWVDKRQCRYENEQGQIQNPTQADCAQAVSAIKAIAIAQAEGQRIYTINQSNAATALPKLPVGGTVGQEIQSAIQAGKEVTFHERGINAHGFSGYGYIITDPDTGGGAYLIEGKGNGSYLDRWGNIDAPFNGNIIALMLFFASLLAAIGGVGGVLLVALVAISIFVSIMNLMVIELALIENGCKGGGFFIAVEIVALMISLIPAFGAAGVSIAAMLSFLSGNAIGSAASKCSLFGR
jgi:hypothetical protein